ncbi:MAG TPA: hypothetical protein VHS03_02895, partial [Gaiellaceae bacterium]|nr:hypothetical protein [Gaiellaceae bacterium]
TSPEGVAVDGPAVLRPRGSRMPSSPNRVLTAAHDLGGVGLRDDAVHVPVVGVQHRTLLAFLSSGCLTCRTFWDALHDPRAVDDDVRVVIVTKDPAEESVSELRRLAPDDVPVVMSGRAWADYGVPGSPYFVLVDGPGERVLGEGTGMSWDQVRTLMQQALTDANGGDAREARIDRELLANGIRPGDPSLYRTADRIARDG